ncbi:MAG: recombinase family protein [Candidatus Buchananbacteria bacterium]|jgi:DNA invertase Pin-like site-specific DNA recombinase
MKYFLYARKSTEDEERQIMSIEAQLAELAEFAKRDGIEIAETYIESKSAKKPGREVFNKMIYAIQASDEPIGIIAWHPDRLARNSIDGGQIIYLIDTGKVVSLRFPTFWFEPTPQGLFMLQVAFGQSKYYSDNLSENVKRGQRQKLRRGEWPGKAPFGYINDARTRNIVIDPVKAKIVQIAFKEFGERKHTLQSLSDRMLELGAVGRTGRQLSNSKIASILKTKTYIGIIEYNGESYEGNFEPIVSQSDFEAVKDELRNRAKPRKVKKKGYDFPFTGFLTCGECGAAITAQYAHGHGGTYIYYRCTKRLSHCSQKYLQQKHLVEQLKGRLGKIALKDEWAKYMLTEIARWEKQSKFDNKDFAQNLDTKLIETDSKLNKLVDEYLEGNIEKQYYLAKKDELIKTKTDLDRKRSDFGRTGNNWIEPMREWIKEANRIGNSALSNDFIAIKSFVKRNGTNRRLLGKKIGWDWNSEFEFLAGLKEKYKIEDSNSPLRGREKFGKNLEFAVMSNFTNEVRTFFQEKSKDFS